MRIHKLRNHGDQKREDQSQDGDVLPTQKDIFGAVQQQEGNCHVEYDNRGEPYLEEQGVRIGISQAAARHQMAQGRHNKERDQGDLRDRNGKILRLRIAAGKSQRLQQIEDNKIGLAHREQVGEGNRCLHLHGAAGDSAVHGSTDRKIQKCRQKQSAKQDHEVLGPSLLEHSRTSDIKQKEKTGKQHCADVKIQVVSSLWIELQCHKR